MLIVLSLLSTHASTVQPRAQPVEADGITTTVAVFMRAHALRGDDNTTDHTDNQRLQHSVDSFQTVYAQPIGAMDVPTHVFVNPSPWPLPNITAAKATVSVLWQRGYPQVSLETPSEANLGSHTGVSAAAAEQAVASGSGPTGDPPNVPYSGVQFTADGVWGAWLNTTGATEHLTTTTMESTFASPSSPCVDVWDANGNGEFRVAFDLAVPTAFKLNATDNGCAVYVSLSVYVRTKPGFPSHFIWYSTDLFDFERDVAHDHVFIDTSSQKLIVSSHVTDSSAYITRLPGSTLSKNDTWREPKTFGYSVSSSHLERGISDGLARFPSHFPKGMPRNASDYCISGFNMELEATPGAGAGINLRGVTISVGLEPASS